MKGSDSRARSIHIHSGSIEINILYTNANIVIRNSSTRVPSDHTWWFISQRESTNAKWKGARATFQPQVVWQDICRCTMILISGRNTSANYVTNRFCTSFIWPHTCKLISAGKATDVTSVIKYWRRRAHWKITFLGTRSKRPLNVSTATWNSELQEVWSRISGFTSWSRPRSACAVIKSSTIPSIWSGTWLSIWNPTQKFKSEHSAQYFHCARLSSRSYWINMATKEKNGMIFSCSRLRITDIRWKLLISKKIHVQTKTSILNTPAAKMTSPRLKKFSRKRLELKKLEKKWPYMKI